MVALSGVAQGYQRLEAAQTGRQRERGREGEAERERASSEERRKVMQQYGMSEEDLAAMEEEGPAWVQLLVQNI